MEKAKDEIIKNYFTKYVETALNRARRDYMKSERKRNGIEIVSEPNLLPFIQQRAEEQEGVLSPDMIYDVPWDSETVRLFLKESVDERMVIALSCLTDTELLIVFAKVFRQMTFMEIAEQMGLDSKKVASTYSYARKKMKKGWTKNGI